MYHPHNSTGFVWREDNLGNCPCCNRPNTNDRWCQPCQAKDFEQEFSSWTSGNLDIDNLIRDSQLNASTPWGYLEWIPFDRLKIIQEVGEGAFGSVYHAVWLDGPKKRWNSYYQRFVSCGEMSVALKLLHNSQNI